MLAVEMPSASVLVIDAVVPGTLNWPSTATGFALPPEAPPKLRKVTVTSYTPMGATVVKIVVGAVGFVEVIVFGASMATVQGR
jgi:hypothetical protein